MLNPLHPVIKTTIPQQLKNTVVANVIAVIGYPGFYALHSYIPVIEKFSFLKSATSAKQFGCNFGESAFNFSCLADSELRKLPFELSSASTSSETVNFSLY